MSLRSKNALSVILKNALVKIPAMHKTALSEVHFFASRSKYANSRSEQFLSLQKSTPKAPVATGSAPEDLRRAIDCVAAAGAGPQERRPGLALDQDA